jgi:RNA polymerase sigma-70 factor, ECF subfamily
MELKHRKNKETLEDYFLRAYDEYSAQILRHVFFRVSDMGTAEDITSEVFMKTWQYMRAGSEVRNIKSFLYKISNNAIVDHYRSRRAGIIPLDDIPEIGEPRSEGFEERLDAHAASVEIIHTHMNALPPEHKQILMYRYIDELDIAEIRELTGKSMTNIYTIIHRALKALRKKITEP